MKKLTLFLSVVALLMFTQSCTDANAASRNKKPKPVDEYTYNVVSSIKEYKDVKTLVKDTTTGCLTFQYTPEGCGCSPSKPVDVQTCGTYTIEKVHVKN